MDSCNQYDINGNKIADDESTIEELRGKLLSEYVDNKDTYDQVDIERVMKNDFWIQRFTHFLNQGKDAGFEHLKACLRWRKSFGLNAWDPLTIPREIYQMGILFEYEPDKEGVVPVYLRLKLYRKIDFIDEKTKKYVINSLAKLDNELGKENGWSFIIDFAGTSVCNLDIPMYLFILKTIRNNFPLGCKYIAIVNLPWALRGIIKQASMVLPSDLRAMIQFITNDQLCQLFDKDKMPDFLHGTCKRAYRVVPKAALSYKDLGPRDFGFNAEQTEKNFKPYLKLFADEIKQIQSEKCR